MRSVDKVKKMNPNQEFNESSNISTKDDSNSEFFIDDYSHLRLSYYQWRGDEPNSTLDSTSDLSLCNIEDPKPIDNDSSDEGRKKLRQYLISQIPDFPHPSCTVASIIASASQRMNSRKSSFIYDKRIEEGVKKKRAPVIFSPERRSTLKTIKRNAF
ncbi:unnamed protein product [Danaus chrysippus]|uniref:(African queen) hypothetical protein n=1 Tax=Danaus chrysippus TaxID=151541 RepID=A0A8J2QSR0_9NEOP|nr:unnamed protein product [Danaus chrysippus]